MLGINYLDFLEKSSKNIYQSDPRTQPLLVPFVKIYNFIIGVGAIPARLLSYKNIGERSISGFGWFLSLIINLCFSYLFGLTYIAIAGSVLVKENFFNSPIESTLEIVFTCLLLIINGVSIYIYRVYIKEGKKFVLSKQSKHQQHITIKHGSYYRGDPIHSSIEDYIGKKVRTIYGRLAINEENFRVHVEPKRVFMFGIYMSLVFLLLSILISFLWSSFWSNWILVLFLSYSATGFLLSVSAVFLFFEEYGIYKRIHNAALDLIDGEKEMEKILKVKMGFSNPSEPLKGEKIKFPSIKIQ